MQTPEFWPVECQGNKSDFFVCIICLNEVFWRRVPCPDCPTCHEVSTYKPFTHEGIEDWGTVELKQKALEAGKEKLKARLEGKL